jgi:hypothetical protein
MNVVPPRVRALAPYPALFLGLVLVGLATLPPGSYSVDGVSMLAVSDSLITQHSFAVPCDIGTPGLGGTCYSSWYPLFSIVMVPFAAVGRALASVAHTPVRPVETVVALVASLLAAAGSAVMTAILARELGASRRATVAAAVGLYFGTELLTFSRTLFAEPLCALLVGLVTWGLLGTGRRRVIGHLAIPLLIHAKPQMILVGLGVAAAIALRDRSFRPVLTAGVATCIGVALYFAYNDLRFGDPLNFGGSERNAAAATGNFGPDSPPIPVRAVIGVGVLLGSPGNGLVFYSPLAILGAIGLLRTRRTRVGAACLGGTIAVLAVYLLQPYGNAWGTRYLVPALPLLAVGLTALRGYLPRLAIIVACLTFVSQVPNLVAFYNRYYRIAAPEARAEGRVQPSSDSWNPHSQLIGVWSSAAGELRDAARTNPKTVLHGSDAGGQDALVKTVAQWWWMTPALGIPLWFGLGVAATMLAAGLALLIRLLRPARSGFS